MSDNPYQAPAEGPPVEEAVKVWTREDLQAVVRNQKGVLATIVVYLLFFIGPFMSPSEGRLFSIFIMVIMGWIGAGYVYPLATMLSSTRHAIICTVLTLIPGIGLIILFLMTVKATKFLKSHGIKVGLLGANLSDI